MTLIRAHWPLAGSTQDVVGDFDGIQHYEDGVRVPGFGSISELTIEFEWTPVDSTEAGWTLVLGYPGTDGGTLDSWAVWVYSNGNLDPGYEVQLYSNYNTHFIPVHDLITVGEINDIKIEFGGGIASFYVGGELVTTETFYPSPYKKEWHGQLLRGVVDSDEDSPSTGFPPRDTITNVVLEALVDLSPAGPDRRGTVRSGMEPFEGQVGAVTSTYIPQAISPVTQEVILDGPYEFTIGAPLEYDYASSQDGTSPEWAYLALVLYRTPDGSPANLSDVGWTDMSEGVNNWVSPGASGEGWNAAMYSRGARSGTNPTITLPSPATEGYLFVIAMRLEEEFLGNTAVWDGWDPTSQVIYHLTVPNGDTTVVAEDGPISMLDSSPVTGPGSPFTGFQPWFAVALNNTIVSVTNEEDITSNAEAFTSQNATPASTSVTTAEDGELEVWAGAGVWDLDDNFDQFGYYDLTLTIGTPAAGADVDGNTGALFAVTQGMWGNRRADAEPPPPGPNYVEEDTFEEHWRDMDASFREGYYIRMDVDDKFTADVGSQRHYDIEMDIEGTFKAQLEQEVFEE